MALQTHKLKQEDYQKYYNFTFSFGVLLLLINLILIFRWSDGPHTTHFQSPYLEMTMIAKRILLQATATLIKLLVVLIPEHFTVMPYVLRISSAVRGVQCKSIPIPSAHILKFTQAGLMPTVASQPNLSETSTK